MIKQNKRKIKLLTKTTSIYLVFTFITFFFSTWFLYNETQEYIDRELEKRYNWSEERVKHDLNKYGKLRKKRSSIKINLVSSMPDKSIYPIYSDTLIINDDSERELLYRKKTTYIENNGSVYKAELLQDITDFAKLQEDIFEGLIPAFVILALVIVLFNFFLSGYFFSPFNKILKQMKLYKVGKGTEIPTVETSTAEFSIMQDLLVGMVRRTENEYTTLKEYTENMAHEIQTPFTVIRNKTENLISDDNIMKSHAASVKTIYNEINHLSKLGTALNLLAKVEHGEFSNNVDIKTKDVIVKHIEGISELVELKQLNIELNLDDNHLLNMDPILFDIVIRNLLNNSINYSTNVGPIKITTKEKRISFSNYGPPLDFAEDKIFSRFAKSNNSVKSVGLGLAIVKKICESNGLDLNYFYSEDQHHFQILNSE